MDPFHPDESEDHDFEPDNLDSDPEEEGDDASPKRVRLHPRPSSEYDFLREPQSPVHPRVFDFFLDDSDGGDDLGGVSTSTAVSMGSSSSARPAQIAETPPLAPVVVPIEFNWPAEEEEGDGETDSLAALIPEIIREFALFLGPEHFLRLSLISQHYARSLQHEFVFFSFSTQPQYYPPGAVMKDDVQKYVRMKHQQENMNWRSFFLLARPLSVLFVTKDAQLFRVYGNPLRMIGLVSEWFVEADRKRLEMLEDYTPGDEDEVLEDMSNQWPIPAVDARPFQKLLEYVSHHWNNRVDEIPKPLGGRLRDLISDYDKRFLEIDQSLLIELIMAANFMNVKDLLDLCCAKLADMLKGKSPEQIREMFGIENDFTPEEEAKIREENKWCEES